MRGQRILLARAAEAPDTVPEGLRARGAIVDVAAAYRTVIAAGADSQTVERLLAGEADVVTFTSSSTVRGFVNALGATRVKELPASVRFVSIGPVTTATARELGLPLAAEAAEHTIPGVVDAILELASGDRTRAS